MGDDILLEVSQVINGERQDAYGKPEDSFAIIADYWNCYLKHRQDMFEDTPPLTSQDVARMMALFKLARMHGQKFSRDNWRDAIGYLAIEADRLQKESAQVEADIYNSMYKKPAGTVTYVDSMFNENWRKKNDK